MPLDFEQGPIRPPSEARSLLVRVTRGCPWNRCDFCPVYKNEKFSVRGVEEIRRDIDTVRDMVGRLREISWGAGLAGRIDRRLAQSILEDPACSESFRSVALWVYYGMESAFLQDANSLVMKTADLVAVVRHLKESFPEIRRITSYARSQTLARTPVEALRSLREAGLDRIHVGLESGSDSVLSDVRKGTTAAQQVEGGRRVIAAGIELSEYVMPGLGGKLLSREHALETARVLNAINPDFIRLRSLALPQATRLRERWEAGEFERLSDEEIVREIRLFVQHLEGITSHLASDHVLNLLEELEGRLPEDKLRLLEAIDRFLALPSEERMLFQLGRRIGLFRSQADLEHPGLRARAQAVREQLGADSQEELEEKIRSLTERFV
ncbi:MAG: radical SAM protein [bacterium]